MRVERIRAASMSDALEKIKLKLGDDAVILNTRSIKEGIEVIAARDADQPKTGNSWLDEVIQKDRELRAGKSSANNDAPKKDLDIYSRKGKASAKHEANKREWNELMNKHMNKPSREFDMNRLEQLEDATRTAREFSELLKDELKTSQEQRKLWIEHEKQLDILKKQLVDLKESILRQELTDLKQRAEKLEKQKLEKKLKAATYQVDQSLKVFYQQINQRLVDRGVAKSTAKEIVDKVESLCTQDKLDYKTQADIQKLKRYLLEEISKKIPVLPHLLKADSLNIISVIGPPRSGKTTTCMKIALRERLINHKKVALILFSNDTGQSAKHLQQLSLAAKLPLAIISGREELEKTLRVHSDKDLVLIDFAVSDIDTINSCMDVISAGQILMTFSLNMNKKEMETMYRDYIKMNSNGIIMTHFDKIRKVGAVIGLLKEFAKPLSIIGNGTIIPDDIEYANATKIAHMILKG